LPEITTITLALPLGLGSVNCYLIKTEAGYVLIDTGSSNQRAALEHELHNAGCQPGNLKIIVLTHGDFDHTGVCHYIPCAMANAQPAQPSGIVSVDHESNSVRRR
jgi:hydroxyacylglutathione hydrolase